VAVSLSARVAMRLVQSPASTRVARFSLDSDDDAADLDVFVYAVGTSTLVDLSASVRPTSRSPC
jgi:hypothetical protein